MRILRITAVVLALLLLAGCVPYDAPKFKADIEAAYDQGHADAITEVQQLRDDYMSQGAVQYKDYVMKNGIILMRPTYQQVIDFIAEDKTNELEQGNCVDLAQRLNNAAIAEGIWCEVIIMNFRYVGEGHVIVAFDTTDKGLIYIEPKTDEEREVKVGGKYLFRACDTNSCRDYYYEIEQIGQFK